MGIRGLRSFIESNSHELLMSHKLTNGMVIIDGLNLTYFLYNTASLASQDYKYGGNYIHYAAVVKRFFHSLKKAKLMPIVIFDGGYDKTGYKLATVFKRLESRLENCKNASKFGLGSGLILPILAPMVMKDILQEMEITFVQSLFEADLDIAKIANYFEAPVVSNDSDFYIYDLNSGFITLDSLDFNIVRKCDEPDGLSKYYLDCKMFNIKNFLSMFEGLKREMLPLFSILMGNDYISQSLFENIFNALPIMIEKRNLKNLKISKRHHNMIRLLDWLRNKKISEAVKFLLTFLKTHKRDDALGSILSTLNFYSSIDKTSILMQYIPEIQVTSSIKLKPIEALHLPDWFIDSFCTGLIDPSLMNIISLKKLLLLPQVDDLKFPSSYQSSVVLQKFLYSLFCFNKPMTITVYDRFGNNYGKSFFHVNPKKLSLKTINLLNDTQRQEELLKCINSSIGHFNETQDSIKVIIQHEDKEEEFVLLSLLIKYWLEVSNGLFLENFLAFLGLICFYHFVANNKKSEAIVDQKARKLIINNFKKFQGNVIHSNSNTFKATIVHHFSQFQSIMLFFTRIQSLLRCSFKPIHIHNYLDGNCLYNLTIDLIRRPQPLLYLNILLGRKTLITKLFNFLVDHIKKDTQLQRWTDKHQGKVKQKVKQTTFVK